MSMFVVLLTSMLLRLRSPWAALSSSVRRWNRSSSWGLGQAQAAGGVLQFGFQLETAQHVGHHLAQNDQGPLSRRVKGLDLAERRC